MTPEERMLEDAKQAVKAGDLERARELLSAYFKVNPRNAEAWIWMSTAVTSEKERLLCLKRALSLDPQNKTAVLGLRLMGEKIGAPLHLRPSCQGSPQKTIPCRDFSGKSQRNPRGSA
jgi:hypothetical protein